MGVPSDSEVEVDTSAYLYMLLPIVVPRRIHKDAGVCIITTSIKYRPSIPVLSLHYPVSDHLCVLELEPLSEVDDDVLIAVLKEL